MGAHPLWQDWRFQGLFFFRVNFVLVVKQTIPFEVVPYLSRWWMSETSVRIICHQQPYYWWLKSGLTSWDDWKINLRKNGQQKKTNCPHNQHQNSKDIINSIYLWQPPTYTTNTRWILNKNTLLQEGYLLILARWIPRITDNGVTLAILVVFWLGWETWNCWFALWAGQPVNLTPPATWVPAHK